MVGVQEFVTVTANGEEGYDKCDVMYEEKSHFH